MLNLRGTDKTGRDMRDPLAAVSAGGNHAGLILGFLQHYYGTGGQDQNLADPLGALTAKARHGLVTVKVGRETYVITDIGMRMLEPEEGAAAHGFTKGSLPDTITIDGKTRKLTKTEKYHLSATACRRAWCSCWRNAMSGRNWRWRRPNEQRTGLPIFDDFSTTSHISIAVILRRLPPWVIFAHDGRIAALSGAARVCGGWRLSRCCPRGLSHVRLQDGSLTPEAAIILIDAGEALQAAAVEADRGAGMSVYVGTMRAAFGRMIMCHMWADDEAELLAMADAIGVQRKWIQGHPVLSFGKHRRASWVHFDIALSKRALAISAGAIETDRYGPLVHTTRLALAAALAAGDRDTIEKAEGMLARIEALRNREGSS